MAWSQEELENVYWEINRRISDDPSFLQEFQADPKAASEKVAGRELPDEFNLRLIEKDGGYVAAFVVPGFTQGEIDRTKLSPEQTEKVAAGISFFAIISFCLAAVAVGPCAVDGCGANACGGNACGGNACGVDACGGNACGGNAAGVGGCAGAACGGDAEGVTGCAGYAATLAPCGENLGCKGYVGVNPG